MRLRKVFLRSLEVEWGADLTPVGGGGDGALPRQKETGRGSACITL